MELFLGLTATRAGNHAVGKYPRIVPLCASSTATALMPEHATYRRFLSGLSAMPKGSTPRNPLTDSAGSSTIVFFTLFERALRPVMLSCAAFDTNISFLPTTTAPGLDPPTD